MKKIILIPVFLFFCLLSFGQNTKIDSLMNVLKNSKADTTKVNLLKAISIEFRNNDPDTAIYFANEALFLATKLNYKMGIADVTLWRGVAMLNIGNYEDALKNSNDALNLYNQLFPFEGAVNKLKILKQKARAFNNIGNINIKKSNYSEALKNYFTSMQIKV